MTAMTPASTGSLTTTSAASGTEPAMLVHNTRIPAARISRTASFDNNGRPSQSPSRTTSRPTRARARGANAAPPFQETARIDSPLSPYAASKAAGEQLVSTWRNLYGLEAISLRFFTVYGARQRPDLTIHKFARLMLEGRKLPFFGDGSSQRDYTFIDDILAGVLAALSVPLSRHEIVNLGGAQTTTLRDLIGLLEEALGVRAELDLKPAQKGDMPLTSADVTHAGKVLGYAPRTPLREGLRLFAEWIRGEGRDWV